MTRFLGWLVALPQLLAIRCNTWRLRAALRKRAREKSQVLEQQGPYVSRITRGKLESPNK